MELDLKLFFGDTRPLVGQLDTGIRLLTPMSRCNQKSLGLVTASNNCLKLFLVITTKN